MGILNNNWNKQEKEPMLSKMKGKINSQPPMKHQIESTQRSLQAMIAKLDQKCLGLKSQDDGLFNKIVTATQKHETDRASAYANELAEVRKMNKMVTQSKLALEQIALRLNTVSELGDVVVTLTPAMGVIRDIQSGVMNILPEAEHEISEINGLLSGILVDAGQIEGHNINFENSNVESRQIMDEASAIADEKMKEQFPDLPSAADSLLPKKNKIEGLFE